MNILLVDDHQLFRTGLNLLLSSEPSFTVVGEVSTGIEMLAFLRDSNQNVDTVLLDISMPEMDGITVARKALEHYPSLKIIVLTMYGEEDYYHSMVELGAKGFLLKSSNISEVTEALRIVGQGGTYFSRELLTSLINNILHKESQETSQHPLSEREIEITDLICKGLTTEEIANALVISKRTVDKHRSNILEKTETKNTANLVVYAIKHKLIKI